MTEPKRVLIVEDEAIVALDLRRQLEANGFAVPAVVGRSALVMGAIATHRPDAVLMDVRLIGDIDGVTLAEEVFVCEDVPVVFLSAFSDREVVRRAARSGAYGYLTKPWSAPALISTLDMAIHKHDDLRARRGQADWLASAFDAMSAAIVGIDEHGAVTFMNRAAVQLTGWLAAEARAGTPPWSAALAEVEADGRARRLPLPARGEAPIEVEVQRLAVRGGGSVCILRAV